MSISILRASHTTTDPIFSRTFEPDHRSVVTTVFVRSSVGGQAVVEARDPADGLWAILGFTSGVPPYATSGEALALGVSQSGPLRVRFVPDVAVGDVSMWWSDRGVQ